MLVQYLRCFSLLKNDTWFALLLKVGPGLRSPAAEPHVCVVGWVLRLKARPG